MISGGDGEGGNQVLFFLFFFLFLWGSVTKVSFLFLFCILPPIFFFGMNSFFLVFF
ncbi:hypothetical protein QBC42DRAFT_278663 [Cladorrhinum samala]|uniref:NADH dehydrogenase subunit 4 n=1 Tax=Cladorrhinum samala TaxID=585594 RepID=A0AAV9HC09_9PEZI|nr:hypothetical protein QBC42DRAFT_278663 [Cladorrhinum samala]